MSSLPSLLKEIQQSIDPRQVQMDYTLARFQQKDFQQFKRTENHLKQRDDFETMRDTNFKTGIDLQETFKNNADSMVSQQNSKTFQIGNPQQWRQHVENEIDSDRYNLEQIHDMNQQLRCEKIGRMNQSAITFDYYSPSTTTVNTRMNSNVKETMQVQEHLALQETKGERYPNGYRLSMACSQFVNAEHPQQSSEQVMGALKGMAMPPVYKKQKGYSSCQPKPREFDLAAPWRKI